MKGKYIKLAWIRNPTNPPGQSGLGHIVCRCGGQTEDYHFKEDAGNHTCNNCGSIFTFDGHVVESHHEDLEARSFRMPR